MILVAGLAGALVTSCKGSGSKPQTSSSSGKVLVVGVVTDYEGNPVGGLYVTAEPVPDPTQIDPQTLSGVRTGSDGSFELEVSSPGERVVVTVLPERAGDGAIAYAPTMGVVKPKTGVGSYRLPLRVPAAQRFDANDGSVSLTSGSRQLTLSVPSGTNGVYYVAGISVDGGIPLDVEGAEPGTQLQSAGMLYIAPAPGAALPEGGFTIDLGPESVPEVPGAESFATWRLSPDGAWSSPVVFPDLATVPRIVNFGFWNCDRSYRTVCIRGTLKGPSGSCGGQRVTQTGPSGIASSDNAGADGGFCVTGAETFPASVSIGRASYSWDLPSDPGNCGLPETCLDIGEVAVSDADCPSDDVPNPPPAEECGSTNAPTSLAELMQGYLGALVAGEAAETAANELMVTECEFDAVAQELADAGEIVDVTYAELRTEFLQTYAEDLARRDWSACALVEVFGANRQTEFGAVIHIADPGFDFDCNYSGVGSACASEDECAAGLSCISPAAGGTAICTLPHVKFDAAVEVDGAFKILGT